MNQFGIQAMLKEGSKYLSGIDESVMRNIEVCLQLAKMTRTSLGPNGLYKMVINHLEKLFVTKDAATIVRELDIEHPAAKIIVMAAQAQAQEIGDYSNFVIVFAGELLHLAASLLKQGLSIPDIVAGYQKAKDFAIARMDSDLLPVHHIEDISDVDKVAKAISSSISAKQYGYEQILAPLVAEACKQVMVLRDGELGFNVDAVRVCKIPGSHPSNSSVIRGVVVQRDTEGNIKAVTNGKVVVYACPLEPDNAETKGTVLIQNADELVNFSKSEESRVKVLVKSIADLGVRVVVAGGKVSELVLHYFDYYKIMVIRIGSKFELRRFGKSVGAKVFVKFVTPESAKDLGYVSEVHVKEIGGFTVTVAETDQSEGGISTILLRAATANLLEDLERACDNGISVVKAITKDNKFIAGAGASEMYLAQLVEEYGATQSGLDQYSIKKFGLALEVIPRTLAETSGMNPTEVVTLLKAAHAKGNHLAGVDIQFPERIDEECKLKPIISVVDDDNLIIDHLLVKKWAIRHATDAAIQVLRVDKIIMARPAGGPKPGARPPGPQ